MIYVKMGTDDFRREIQDILRLFYNNEEIEITDIGPPKDRSGVFLLIICREESGTGQIIIELKLDQLILYNTKIALQDNNSKESHGTTRKELKRELYKALVKATGKNLPWGMLTGIRPAKIAREMLQKGCGKDEIHDRMKNYYFVSEEKISLAYNVAVEESKILENTPDNAVGLYIGIPFCPTRCLYCSFTSNSIDKYRHLLDGYIKALKKEIEFAGGIIQKNGYCLQSLYIGGGTPTSLDEFHLKELLESIEDSLELKELKEYTLEAGRPDSIDQVKLETIKSSKVSRISINPQTMNDETLRLIGRKHTSQNIITAFKLAREIGFDNINMDVIVGLPGETLPMFENTLNKVKELGPESLTVHTMAIKRASRLNENKEEYKLISDQEATAMVGLAMKYAKDMQMHPYYLYRQKNILGNLENIGYCSDGQESIYNIQIMEEKQTIIALGAGAVTKVVYPGENRLERAFNVKNVEEYVKRIDEMIDRKKNLLTH